MPVIYALFRSAINSIEMRTLKISRAAQQPVL